MGLKYRWSKTDIKKIDIARDEAIKRIRAVNHEPKVDQALNEGGVMHFYNVLMERED